MDFILIAFLGLILTYCVYLYYMHPGNYWKRRRFPYLSSNIFFGTMLDVVMLRKNFYQNVRNTYNTMQGLNSRYVGFQEFQRPVLLIMDPELVYDVLVKNFSCFIDRDFIDNVECAPLFKSIFSMKGLEWRPVRRKFAPTFSSGKLKTMFEELVRCSDDIIIYMRDCVQFEARSSTGMLALNAIGSVAYGLKLETHKEKQSDNSILRVVNRFFQPSSATVLQTLFVINFPWLAKTMRIKLTDDRVNKFFFRLIREGVKIRKEVGQRDDFFQTMIDMSDTKTSKNTLVEEKHAFEIFMASNTFQFLSAGGEGICNTLSFALFELANNQVVQKRLQIEVDRAFDQNGFNYESVSELQYLTQILNEVMRHNPPLEAVERVCTEDYPIPGTDHVIKRGESIAIPVAGIHFDPQHWKNPEAFDPDRFEDMTKIRNGTFLPFGLGPRNCLASRFSMLLMKVFVSRLVYSYDLKLSSKTRVPLKKLVSSMIHHVEGGIWIEIEARRK